MREALALGVSRLREAGVVEAELDAELLLRYSLGWDRAQFLTRREQALTDCQYERFVTLVARRSTGRPMQYILGSQEFFGREFVVSAAVLIPRPETELLVEAALARLSVTKNVYISDVGTGSGAIAVTIAAERPLARILATDISADALIVARENAVKHGVSDRVEFVEADVVPQGADGFDMIVSNPPYVAEADRAGLAHEVRDFEPEVALFAGAEGLDVYRRLIPAALHALKPGGLLLLEIGAGQADAVRALLHGWRDVEIRPDLQGIPRVVVARSGE